MKLPVRFARILFLRSPGASSRVRASVLECNAEFVEGRISLYDEAGQPCVLVDGFRAISIAGVRRSGAPGGIRDLLYHVGWERTPTDIGPAPRPPVPLARLRPRQGRYARVWLAMVIYFLYLNLVAAGLGVTIVPASLSRLPLEGVIYRPLRGRPAIKVPLNLACRRDERSAATLGFIDLVRRLPS